MPAVCSDRARFETWELHAWIRNWNVGLLAGRIYRTGWHMPPVPSGREHSEWAMSWTVLNPPGSTRHRRLLKLNGRIIGRCWFSLQGTIRNSRGSTEVYTRGTWMSSPDWRRSTDTLRASAR